MKINLWTLGLASVGAISLASVAHAEEAPKMNSVLTAVSSTTLSGYVDTSAVWKFGTGNSPLPGRVYDGPIKQDGFNLNVVSLTLDKPLEEGSWSAGYHVQALFGPDAVQRGTRSFIGGNAGDFALNEAYVALRAPVGNGIDFKVGQFGTFNGYEAFDSYKNPNWSRSFGFNIETSAHVGVTASYVFTEWLSATFGVGNAYNSNIDARPEAESVKTYLGMITLTAPESFGTLKGATLSAGVTSGEASSANVSGVAGSSTPRINQFYVGASVPTPITGVSVGAAYDYTDNAAGIESAYANATALYVTIQATEKLKLNNRLDYGTGTSGGLFYVAPAGKSAELIAYTLTADYAIWANVVSRLEFRYDHALTGAPFADSDKNAMSLAANIIYKF